MVFSCWCPQRKVKLVAPPAAIAVSPTAIKSHDESVYCASVTRQDQVNVADCLPDPSCRDEESIAETPVKNATEECHTTITITPYTVTCDQNFESENASQDCKPECEATNDMNSLSREGHGTPAPSDHSGSDSPVISESLDVLVEKMVVGSVADEAVDVNEELNGLEGFQTVIRYSTDAKAESASVGHDNKRAGHDCEEPSPVAEVPVEPTAEPVNSGAGSPMDSNSLPETASCESESVSDFSEPIDVPAKQVSDVEAFGDDASWGFGDGRASLPVTCEEIIDPLPDSDQIEDSPSHDGFGELLPTAATSIDEADEPASQMVGIVSSSLPTLVTEGPHYIDEFNISPDEQYNTAASVPFFNSCSATLGYPTARLLQYRLHGIVSIPRIGKPPRDSIA